MSKNNAKNLPQQNAGNKAEDNNQNVVQKAGLAVRGKYGVFKTNHPRIARAVGIAGAGVALVASYALGYHVGSGSRNGSGMTIIDADAQDAEQQFDEAVSDMGDATE